MADASMETPTTPTPTGEEATKEKKPTAKELRMLKRAEEVSHFFTLYYMFLRLHACFQSIFVFRKYDFLTHIMFPP